MEFLFSNQVASFEAITVLLSIALIVIILLYDTYLFLARVLGILTPRKVYTKEKITDVEKKEEIPIIEAKQLPEYAESIVSIPEVAIEGENITGDATEQISEELSNEERILLEASDPEIALNSLPRVPASSEEIPSPATEMIEEQSKNLQSEEEFVEGDQEILEIQDTIIPEESFIEQPHEEKPSESSVASIPPSQEVSPEAETREGIGEYMEVISPEVQDDSGIFTPIATEEIKEEMKSESTENPTIESLILKAEQDTQVPTDLGREEVPKKKFLPQISPENREKLVNITGTVRTLVARGHLVEARALIIEGLSISKMHRELNIILGEIYERDHAFDKAEFIYKDIAHIYGDDVEILMHLAASLAMQRKYRLSYEFYKKILTLNGDSEELLYTLTHLASELSEIDDMYEYARNYNNQYPKNPEILWLFSQSLIARGSRREAIEVLIKLKNLTPYSQEIIDLIGKLVVEEEMAGNFGGEQI